jgi:mitotic spindle assembly checkpoint protein MAD1
MPFDARRRTGEALSHFLPSRRSLISPSSSRRSAFLGPSDVSEFSSPRKVTKTLAATRIENATFREKLDSHHLELHKRDRIIGELEAQVSNLQAELEDSDKALSAAERRVRQDENRGKLLKQEVEMLKRHLVRPRSV